MYESCTLKRLEKIMVLKPNFQAQKWSIRVQEEENTVLPYTYAELIAMTMRFIKNPEFKERFYDYFTERRFQPMKFRGEWHKKLFNNEVKIRNAISPTMLAALYLLTADNRLWLRAKDHVSYHNVDFEQIYIGDISPASYTFFMTAKDLCRGTKHITISDLADKETISNKLFGIICEAMTLRRYGLAALNAAKDSKLNEIGEKK